MSQDSLRQLLTELHQRLSSGAVEPEARQLLGTIVRDIERTLGTGPVAAEHASRLESLAVQFEAGHPALAQTLRQLIDLLGKAGL
jgi:predicted component of type VI protein secretion system